MNGLTGHMTKHVFYDGDGADTPAYDGRHVTLKPGKKEQVNTTYELGSPPPPGGHKSAGTKRAAPHRAPAQRLAHGAIPRLPRKTLGDIPQN